jgi:hypothetical protein
MYHAPLLSLKSIGVLAAVVLGTAASSAFAAPGTFQLTGAPSCSFFTPTILFHWTTSTGATSYELRRDDGQNTVVSVSQPYDTNVVVGGPAHSYFVRASDGVATTDSNIVTVAPPPTPCSPPPEPFTITGMALCYPGNPSFPMSPAEELDWHAARYGTSYDIYKNGALYRTLHGIANSYTYIGGSIFDGSTSTYYVVAKNAAGTSTSNTVQFTVPADICVTTPPVPVLSGGATCDSQKHQPAVRLYWTINPGVEGWKLYRDGTLYASPEDSQYLDTNVVPGHTYTYNVSTTGLAAPLSNPIVVTASDAVCTPGPVTFTYQVLCYYDTLMVLLIWPATTNAASYTIMRDDVPIASGLSPSTFSFSTYYDASVVPGTTYSYRVIATNSSASTSSAPAAITATEACPPSYFTVSAAAVCAHSAPAVHLTWSASTHAASYSVLRDGVPVGSALAATAREYIDEGVSIGYHEYNVKATNAFSSQLSTTSVTVSTAPCGFAPAPFTASVSGTCEAGTPAIRIDWSAASGASSYVVSRNGVTLPGERTSAPAVWIDTTMTVGQSYTYTVTASNANGKTVAEAGTITPSLGDCPPNAFTLLASTGCKPPVSLAWTPSSNHVLTYSIYREQLLMMTVEPGTLTYADNSALAGVSYDYFVRAAGTGGATDSNVATVHVASCDPAPTPDLTAISVKPSASSARAGDTMSVNIELTNRGTIAAMPSTARIRFGRGPLMSSSDLVLATIVLPTINFGDDIQRTANIKLPAVASGTYYLFLTLDEEHVSGDDHLADNVKVSAPLNLADMIPPRRRAAGH